MYVVERVGGGAEFSVHSVTDSERTVVHLSQVCDKVENVIIITIFVNVSN